MTNTKADYKISYFNRKLRKHLKILSDDYMEGRCTGTRGIERAQKYIMNQYSKCNLSFLNDLDSYKDTHIIKKLNIKQSIKHQHKHNAQPIKNLKITNILGTIKGTSDKTIVICAHYDHLGIIDGQIYNGADDNASGVSALLVMMEYFSKKKPKHTLIFACFDGEEISLLGSEYFVKKYIVNKNHNIVLNVNLDMLCNNDKFYNSQLREKGLLINGIGYSKNINWNKILGNLIQYFVYNKTKEEAWVRVQDSYHFHKESIVWLYIGVDDYDSYHTYKDVYQSINLKTFYRHFILILLLIKRIDKRFQ